MRFLWCSLVVCLLATSFSQAEEKPFSNLGKGAEWTVGVLSAYTNIGGDFDGNRIYTNDISAAVVPSIDPALAWGASFGLKSRAYDNVAVGLETSFLRSQHDGEWAGVPYQSVHQEINVDLKLFLQPRERFQPYGMVGFSIPSVKVKSGGVLNTGQTKDATYRGTGLQVGVGFLYYLTERFSMHVQPMLRFGEYSDLEINKKVGELNDPLSLDEFLVRVGATFHFQSKL